MRANLFELDFNVMHFRFVKRWLWFFIHYLTIKNSNCRLWLVLNIRDKPFYFYLDVSDSPFEMLIHISCTIIRIILISFNQSIACGRHSPHQYKWRRNKKINMHLYKCEELQMQKYFSVLTLRIYDIEKNIIIRRINISIKLKQFNSQTIWKSVFSVTDHKSAPSQVVQVWDNSKCKPFYDSWILFIFIFVSRNGFMCLCIECVSKCKRRIKIIFKFKYVELTV